MKNTFINSLLAVMLTFLFVTPSLADDFNEAYIPAIALYPQQNAVRNRLDLIEWYMELPARSKR